MTFGAHVNDLNDVDREALRFARDQVVCAIVDSSSHDSERWRLLDRQIIIAIDKVLADRPDFDVPAVITTREEWVAWGTRIQVEYARIERARDPRLF